MLRMTRPGLFLTAAMVVILAGCRDEGGGGGPGLPRPVLDRPNVVIFFLDDSGYADFSHNGHPTVATPVIDRMAREGVSFTQFYVPAAACTASRYSLLTGRYPARSGLGTWVVAPKSSRFLHPDEQTLAEVLKSKGYATGAFGKWHLGTPNENNEFNSESWPLAHGFDEWIGTDVSHDYKLSRLAVSDASSREPVSGYRVLSERLRHNKDVNASLTGQYTDAAIAFIDKNKERPFLAYVAHNQPHLSLACSDAFQGKSRRGLFGDVMAELDHSVGRILAALVDAGIDRNTLVIFTSDNGPWVRFRDTAEHDTYGEARLNIGSALPFRDGKGSTWEGGHRVPGIFYWPGVIEPQRTEEPASTLDILPTVTMLAGAEIQKGRTVDGRDIRILLGDRWTEKQPPAPFELLYSAADNAASAYRFGPWKIHTRLQSQTGDNYGFAASREKPLLFQVEQDVGERFDRAAEQPEKVQELLKRLEALEERIKAEGNDWDK